MHYKTSTTTITTNLPDKMASNAPVAIGTRGTIGSLVRKEIEYFNKLELDQSGSSRKPKRPMVDMVSGATSRSHNSKTSSLWSLSLSWRRKKRRGSIGLLPSFCSTADIADTNQLNGVPRFGYRILESELKDMHV